MIDQKEFKVLTRTTDAPTQEKSAPSIDVLSELRANLKQVKLLQAKLHFMTQEIKEVIKRK